LLEGVGQSRAFLVATRSRVQDIYAQSEIHEKTPEQIAAAFSHITLAQVYAALAYYFDNRESILNEMRQDDAFLTLLKSRTRHWPARTEAKSHGSR